MKELSMILKVKTRCYLSNDYRILSNNWNSIEIRG